MARDRNGSHPYSMRDYIHKIEKKQISANTDTFETESIHIYRYYLR